MAETQKQEDKSKDGLALILGGIFILGLVFAAYTYFNRNDNINNTDLSPEEANAINKLDNISSANTQRDNNNTNSNENVAGASTSISNGIAWVATDYKNGDITSGSYTVKSGDTLWEIAEAVYGNGAEWAKILNANKDSIGFLPNGSHALIVTGQTLTLP